MSDHTPTCCRNFIGSDARSCDRCGDSLADHERLYRIYDAAPDMYEALKQAETWLEGWASAEPYLSIIRAALAKAEQP